MVSVSGPYFHSSYDHWPFIKKRIRLYNVMLNSMHIIYLFFTYFLFLFSHSRNPTCICLSLIILYVVTIYIHQSSIVTKMRVCTWWVHTRSVSSFRLFGKIFHYSTVIMQFNIQSNLYRICLTFVKFYSDSWYSCSSIANLWFIRLSFYGFYEKECEENVWWIQLLRYYYGTTFGQTF